MLALRLALVAASWDKFDSFKSLVSQNRKVAMKIIVPALAVLLGSVCHAQTKPPSSGPVEVPSCLIVKHAGGFFAFAHNANWEYVAGDFPKGMKWKGLTDRNIRKIKEKGAHVVVIRSDYKAEDLAQAQERFEKKKWDATLIPFLSQMPLYIFS